MRPHLPWWLFVVVVVIVLLSAGSAALAATLPPDLPGLDLTVGAAVPDTPRPASTATVVRELLEERNQTSATYLLSDGTRRTIIFAAPVFYQTDDGSWQPLDKHLLVDPYGVARPAGVGFDLVFSSERFGMPVRLGVDGSVVGVDLLAAAEGAPVIDGARAIYPDVALDTDLVYETLPEGVKGTLQLKSRNAPASFSFLISHEGMTAKKGADGLWGFYRAADKHPFFVIDELLVFDSSLDKQGEPAYCHAAKTTVAETAAGSYVTYEVPRNWLAQKDRVFPVLLDPTITKGAAATKTFDASQDTYISYRTPDSSFATSKLLKCGSSSKSDFFASLIKFNLGALKDPAVYVADAHLKLHQASGDTSKPAHIWSSPKSWTPDVTWNSYWLPDLTNRGVGSPTAGTDKWVSQSCRGAVQAWANNADPNYANDGFFMSQTEDSTSYYHEYDSANAIDANLRPQLVVDYEKPNFGVSDVATAYRLGDTVTVHVKLHTAYAADIRDIQIGINRNRNDGRYRGVMGWFGKIDKGLPGQIPSDGWQLSPYDRQHGGWFAYYRNDSDSFGSRYMTPLLDQCSVNTADQSEVTFRFKVNDNWGDVQDNVVSVRFGMSYTDDSFPFNSDWMDSQASFDVTPVLTQAPTASLKATSDWFSEQDTNGDGINDARNDANSAGRGSVTLHWQPVSAADGYDIMLWDGATYRPVGHIPLGDASTWTSGDLYPSDSEIATASSSLIADPFRRAQSPADATQTAALPTPQLQGSAGVLANDGHYLYVLGRAGRLDGPTSWQRFDSASGAFAGSFPTTPGVPRPQSAFCYHGMVYSGLVHVPAGQLHGPPPPPPYVVGVNFNGDSRHLALDQRPLDCDSGGAAGDLSTSVMLTVEGDKLYSVAAATLNGSDGYAVCVYDLTPAADEAANDQAAVSDGWFVAMPTAPLSGVAADGRFLYLLAHHADKSATLSKLALASHGCVDQWAVGAGSDATSLAWDATDRVFWLGSLGKIAVDPTKPVGPTNPADQAKLYQYDTGLQLRDDPNALYQHTDLAGDGFACGSWTHYSFKVVPYNSASTLPRATEAAGAPGIPVTLDNRTQHLSEAPQETDFALPFPHQSIAVALAKADGRATQFSHGSLQIAVTDLAIASWGPPAVLDRYYSSKRPASAGDYFAPGWRFGFERCLELGQVDAGRITYVAKNGDAYVFREVAGAWLAPNGLHAGLTCDPDAYCLTFADHTSLHFDTNGRLSAETDRNGNAVTYTWSDFDNDTICDLTIAAANGQTIAVNMLANGRIFDAFYSTDAGARSGDYVGGPLTSYSVGGSGWHVNHSRPLGQADWGDYYFYNGEGRIGETWLYDYGKSHHDRINPESRLGFDYDTSGRVKQVSLPDFWQPGPGQDKYQLDIAYAAHQATISRWGRVAASDADPTALDPTSGAPADELVALETVVAFNESGSEAAISDAHRASQARYGQTSFAYGPDNQARHESLPAGAPPGPPTTSQATRSRRPTSSATAPSRSMPTIR